MDDITSDKKWLALAKLKRKRESLAAKQDERIKQVCKILGEPNYPWCKRCKELVSVLPHRKTCVLRRLNPEVLKAGIDDAHILLRKEANKQRIFKSDQKSWNGLPGKKTKTLVRKRRSNNRGPVREMQKCNVCKQRTLFTNHRCSMCEHATPCNYITTGKNCQRCHPDE